MCVCLSFVSVLAFDDTFHIGADLDISEFQMFKLVNLCCLVKKIFNRSIGSSIFFCLLWKFSFSLIIIDFNDTLKKQNPVVLLLIS